MNPIEWFLIDILWGGIAFGLGFAFCRLVTFGRYPELPMPERDKTWMQVIGTVVFIGIVALVAWML